MENRFWFCDPSRKRRRGDDDVQYACESYARPSGDVSHGFLREVERKRREHVFYSVIPAVILRTWDEGLQAYPSQQAFARSSVNEVSSSTHGRKCSMALAGC